MMDVLLLPKKIIFHDELDSKKESQMLIDIFSTELNRNLQMQKMKERKKGEEHMNDLKKINQQEEIYIPGLSAK